MARPRDLPLAEFYQGRILNFAHRGARMEAPENTIPAFERAAELGSDGIELDVQLSADGVPVVFHDFDLSRIGHGNKLVRQQRFDDLRRLDVGAPFSPVFSGTRIPTLGEVFEVVGRKLLINVELKYFGFERRAIHKLVQAVIATVAEHNLFRRVLLSSFNPLALAHARRLAPSIPIGLLYDPKLPFPVWWARLLVGYHQAEHPHFSMIDARYVRWARQRGFRINVWTVNEPQDIQRMIGLGVDMLMSDYPDRVQRALHQWSMPNG